MGSAESVWWRWCRRGAEGVQGRGEGASHLLARVREAPGAAVVERGSHKEVGRHLALVGVDALLARGELAERVKGDRRDLVHVVVRRPVAQLLRCHAGRVKDGDRVGRAVGQPKLTRTCGVPRKRGWCVERHVGHRHHRACGAERAGTASGMAGKTRRQRRRRGRWRW